MGGLIARIPNKEVARLYAIDNYEDGKRCLIPAIIEKFGIKEKDAIKIYDHVKSEMTVYKREQRKKDKYIPKYKGRNREKFIFDDSALTK